MGDIHSNRKTLFHNGPSKSYFFRCSHISACFFLHTAQKALTECFRIWSSHCWNCFGVRFLFHLIHKELYFEVCLLSSRKRQIRYSRYRWKYQEHSIFAIQDVEAFHNFQDFVQEIPSFHSQAIGCRFRKSLLVLNHGWYMGVSDTSPSDIVIPLTCRGSLHRNKDTYRKSQDFYIKVMPDLQFRRIQGLKGWNLYLPVCPLWP